MILTANEISGTVTIAQLGDAAETSEAANSPSNMGEFVYNPHWLEKNGIDPELVK